jgi:hypothetical protein
VLTAYSSRAGKFSAETLSVCRRRRQVIETSLRAETANVPPNQYREVAEE